MELKKITSVFVIVIALASALAVPEILEDDDHEKTKPTEELPGEYIIIAQEPENEEERAMLASLSALAVHDGFHPIFLLEDGELDSHVLWTIQHSNYKDMEKLVFSKDDSVLEAIGEQLGDDSLTKMPFEKKSFNKAMKTFKGFNGAISVGSYEEAIWVSSLAAKQGKIITLGKSSYGSQEEVWDELSKEGVDGSYVIITNPDDWMGKEKFYTVFNDRNSSYHIPSLSYVAAELAAYHNAYVITDIDLKTNFSDEFKDMLPPEDPHLNDKAISTLIMLREINENYGGITNICPIGSAEAVPQFELPDYSDSEPDYTSSDVVYAFLDDDPYDMDAGLGRIVNYNVQGAFNMVARTLGYDQIDETVTVESDEGTRTVEWRKHGSSWNGYEVADIRLQNSPSMVFQRDMEDEGYTCDWYSTGGPGATDSGLPASNIRAGLEVSGLVAYRGHGSWHGSIYQWSYYAEAGASIGFGYGDDERGHLEGTEANEHFYPPQVGMIVSCENAKIHGLSYGGDPIDMEKAFATNYLYGGAIGLCSATEVSYSNIGQDGYVAAGQATGDSEWDMNDLWYAAFWDNILDGAFVDGQHDGPETDAGHALMNSENRYLNEHEGISPMLAGDGADWKEVAMFTYYGDPAFYPYHMIEGPNDYDPWH